MAAAKRCKETSPEGKTPALLAITKVLLVSGPLGLLLPPCFRFLLRDEVFRPDVKRAARVTSTGGWLNLDERKLVAPPPALLAAMNLLDRTSDFIVLPSSVGGRG